MKPLIFRPAAAADVEDAYLWYENQRAGLGEEFLAAVTTVVEFLLTYHARATTPTTVAISQLMANHWAEKDEANRAYHPKRSSDRSRVDSAISTAVGLIGFAGSNTVLLVVAGLALAAVPRFFRF